MYVLTCIHTSYNSQKTRNRPWIFLFCSSRKCFRFLLAFFFLLFFVSSPSMAHDNWPDRVWVFMSAWMNCDFRGRPTIVTRADTKSSISSHCENKCDRTTATSRHCLNDLMPEMPSMAWRALEVIMFSHQRMLSRLTDIKKKKKLKTKKNFGKNAPKSH